MNKIVLLTVAIALICSCSKGVVVEQPKEPPVEEKPPEEPPKIPKLLDPEHPYLGRWKLLGVSLVKFSDPRLFHPGSFPYLGYSEADVFFLFKADNTLIVSGDMEHPNIQWYIENGHSEELKQVCWPGTYTYYAHHDERDHKNIWNIYLTRDDDHELPHLHGGFLAISEIPMEAPRMILAWVPSPSHDWVKVEEEEEVTERR